MLTRPTLTALRAALDAPLARLLRATEAAAQEANCDLWLVGGAVRDLACGAPVEDLDLAVRGDLGALLAVISARLRLPAEDALHTPRFGTASVFLDAARIDFAHLRTERYVAPGALPTVRRTDRIEADLKRRDFTVNAIAFGLTGDDRGRIIDPFEGLRDLDARVLRVLHERSFVDDATRLWRGARTASLFDLAPDPTTERLIHEGTRWLEPVSGERLWTEFVHTAHRGRPGRTVALLDAWGVLRGTHEAWRLPDASARALRGRHPMPPSRLAAVLLAPLSKRQGVLERLGASKDVRATVEATTRLLEAGRSGARDADVLAGLEGTRVDARTAALWLDADCQRPLQRALGRWERTRPPLSAEELVALGVPRGPALGAALAELRRARYLGTLGSGTEARRAARAEVRRRIATGEGWD